MIFASRSASPRGGRAAPAAAALLLLLGLSACSGMPSPGLHVGHGAPLKPTKGLTVQQRVEKAVELLGQGDAPRARVELVQALKDDPGQPAARNLLGQIDIAPKTLLGAESYPYTVKAGDTLYGLADRLLGDRLKFYALARYNGMAKPEELKVGQILQIPGVEKKPAPPPPPPPARKPAAPPAAPAPAKPPARATDPARAKQLRGEALKNMNRGAIDSAVDLLREALQLDPGNSLIQHDLTLRVAHPGDLARHPLNCAAQVIPAARHSLKPAAPKLRRSAAVGRRRDRHDTAGGTLC